MNRPPVLTPEERAQALEKAKTSRSHRAKVKAQVKDGALSISEVLDLAKSEEAIAKMRVAELLESISGVGKVRAIAILDRLGISRTRRLLGLGHHQREALIKEFAIPRHDLHDGQLVVLSGPGGVGKVQSHKRLDAVMNFG